MLTGADSIKRALSAFERELGATYGGRVTREINQAGGRAAARVVRARTPTFTGNLKRSVRVIARRSRGTSTASTAYYTVIGFKLPEGAHALLIEGGTASRVQRNGRSVGAVAATRFFTRALEVSKPLIFQAQVKAASGAFRKQSLKMRQAFR